MKNRDFLALGLAMLTALSTGAVAQQPAAEPAMHAKASAPRVTVAVTVRDKKGAPVAGVAKAELTLTEDGRAQTIESVTPASATPLRLGVVLDTSREMTGSIEPVRKAATKFVDQMLPSPSDGAAASQAFVLHYDRQVELLEDFTADHAKLDRELEQMTPSHGGRDDRGGPETTDDERGAPGERGGGRLSRGGAQLYDAIYLAANELMKPAPGRHVLVILSDGVDRGSKESLNDAVDAAERAGLTVFTIYLKGERDREFEDVGRSGGRRGGMGGGWPGGGGGYPGGGGRSGDEHQPAADGKKTLEKIAERTGGRAFEAKKKEALDELYSQIASEIGNQLLVSYTPDMADKEGGFHKVAVKTTRADATVAVPEGYYAPGSGVK